MDWWFSIPMGIGIIAILATTFSASTADNPAGLAGVYAPLVALCTASIAFTQVIHPGGQRQRNVARIAIGLGSIVSAYLWLASESELHPTSLELLRGMGLVILVTATLTVVVPIGMLLSRSHSQDQTLGDDEQS